MAMTIELIQQLRGRAAFLRDKGRVKSPQLMEQAANELESHLTQPAQAVDVVYDGALNDACWAFIDAGGFQFNNVKPALKAAIEKWLSTRALAGEKAEDGLAARIRARLPIIRASTGNPLFDAGTHDACEKIAALLPTPPTDGDG